MTQSILGLQDFAVTRCPNCGLEIVRPDVHGTSTCTIMKPDKSIWQYNRELYPDGVKVRNPDGSRVVE